MSFEYRFVLEPDDWKRAADMAEATEAFARPWRLLGGIMLLAFGLALVAGGVYVIFEAFVALGKFWGKMGLYIGLFGAAAIFGSYLAAWRPLFQDLQYMAQLKGGTAVRVAFTDIALEMTVHDQVRVIGWGDMQFITDGVDGVLVRTKKSFQLCWLPARVFASACEQSALVDRVARLGIRRRGIGSG